MSLFSPDFTTPGTGQRLTGMSRLKELLDRDFKRFLIINLMTVLAFSPLFAGIIFSLLSSSLLILIPVCIAGGLLSGPALSCMYDAVFRSFRDASTNWFDQYRHAWKQNWRQSLLPGILLSLFLGFYAFMAALFFWSAQTPSIGTILVYCLGIFLITAFITVSWPQLVLFDQPSGQLIKNSILFIIRFFWKTAGCALLQILYWFIILLFLPWSVILLPLIGFWLVLFIANYLLYPTFDEVFEIEKRIAEIFPEQAVYYESDEEWVKRKQKDQ